MVHEGSQPTIKGIYVNSHIRALKQQRGLAAVRTLEQKYGRPVEFKNSEDVPVREEVKIIEYILDIMDSRRLPTEERAYEAGRLHFSNFASTPFARIIFSVFRRSFKMLAMQAMNIAGHVFRGVKFSAVDTGPQSVKVIMENNDYPLAHFRGFFEAWLQYASYRGTVEAVITGPNRYEYTIQWT